MKSRLLFQIWLMVIMLVTSSWGKETCVIDGLTMGTTYRVKVVTDNPGSVEGLKEKIDRRLDEINRSLSSYLKESEISRFGRFREVAEDFPISDDFLWVMKVAARVYQLSDGAWDGTVNPLVDLWGFGRSDNYVRKPPTEKINAVLKNVGFHLIEIKDPPGALAKHNPAVTLDLSSIAKGYGADQMAALIQKGGYRDYLVEIGGEVIGAGVRPDGQPWRIGIRRPRPEEGLDQIYRVISLQNQAIATSGDYQNFFMEDGVRYSHIIDPRNGRPVSNGVVSATITAESCTLADGLATAVMVMGAEKGLALISRLGGIEGMIIVETPEGTLREYLSTGFGLDSTRKGSSAITH